MSWQDISPSLEDNYRRFASNLGSHRKRAIPYKDLPLSIYTVYEPAPKVESIKCVLFRKTFQCGGHVSKSFRDRPKWKTAELKFPKDREKKFIYPRVIQSACLKKEYFPLNKVAFSALLRFLPKEYIYGLKKIELRPRPGKEIANPLAYYRSGEKTIFLFSVPKGIWKFDKIGNTGYYELHGAAITTNADSSVTVVWKDRLDLAFMYYVVFLHELGHHYQHQYRTKKGIPNSSASREKFADFISSKLQNGKHFFKVWKDPSTESRII